MKTRLIITDYRNEEPVEKVRIFVDENGVAVMEGDTDLISTLSEGIAIGNSSDRILPNNGKAFIAALYEKLTTPPLVARLVPPEKPQP